jgi:tetratricopeptide (TPR) repeat protein
MKEHPGDWRLRAAPHRRADYEAALERSLRSFQRYEEVLNQEREEAPNRLARLGDLSSGGRDLLLRNSPRFQTWGLFELLVRTGKEETFVNPAQAEKLLHLALEVSSRLDSSFYGKERIEDLRARTWGYIGNARRANGDLDASEEAFSEAFLRLPSGTDDPMERAILCDLKASLLRVQQCFEESLRLSQRAIAVFRRLGENHRVGRSLVNMSIAYRFTNNPEKAISLLYQSLDLIDRDHEPRVVLCALNNLSEGLVTADRFMEAQKVVARARPLYRSFPEPMVQSRRLWVEAKIAQGLGHLQTAEELLQQAKVLIFEVGTAFDRSFISRDLDSLKAH